MSVFEQAPVRYEEGSWTPVVAGGTVAGTQTYATQVGRYVRTGNIVTVWFNVILSAKDVAGSGTVRITGLPYASASITGLNAVGTLRTSNVTLPAGCTQSGLYGNTGGTLLLCSATGSGVAASSIDFATGVANNSSFIGQITYRI